MSRIGTRNQPQGLLLLNPVSSLADKFWLPSGNQFYGVHNKSVLTRGAGTSPITAYPKGLGLKGDGATYFAVPSITLAPPYSISVLTSAPTGGTNTSMVIGDVASTAHFLWVNDGSNEGRWRVNSGDIIFVNSNFNIPSVYTLTVSAAGFCSVYKDGKLLTTQSNASATFVLSSIGAGYSGGSFIMNGGSVFGVQVNSKKELSAAEVQQVSDSFWTPLLPNPSKRIGQQIASVVSPTNVSCTLATVTDTGLSASVLFTTTVACNLATVAVAGQSAGVSSGTITITNIVSKIFKLTNIATKVGSIPISVSWSGATPTAIQAQFNGGSWTTFIASPTGNSGSGTLTNVPAGQGILNVRFVNDTTVNTFAPQVGVGLVIATGGQSNNIGHNTQYGLYPTHATLVAKEFALDGTWINLADSAAEAYHNTSTRTPNTAINGSGEGSYFGGLATKIMATGMPVGFVPVAVGSTSAITDWQPGTDHFNTAQLYGSMTTRIQAADCNLLIWYQGESDSNATGAAYTTALTNIINNVWADVGVPTMIFVPNSQGGWLTPQSNLYPVQIAQRQMGATLAHAYNGAEMDGAWTTGGVHYTTTAFAQEVANRAFNVISANFLGGTVVASTAPNIGVTGLTANVYNGVAFVGANASQSNTSSTGVITQGQVLVGANSTETSYTSTGVITQIQVLVGANSIEANYTSTGVITQGQVLAGSNSIEANYTSTGVIGQNGQFVAANSSQSNVSSLGVITQIQVLVGSNSIEASYTSTGVIGQNDQLIAANVTQANSTLTGVITQSQQLIGATSVETNSSSVLAITQLQQLVGANSVISNLASIGSIAVGSSFLGAPSNQNNSSSVSTITQVQNLVAINSSQANNSSTGIIVQALQLVALGTLQANNSSTLNISQVQQLVALGSGQFNFSSTGVISQTSVSTYVPSTLRTIVLTTSDTQNEIAQSPNANLDYSFDWTNLLQAGESLVSSSWLVPVALTASRNQLVSNITSVFVSGGVVDHVYHIVNTITTNTGRTDSKTIRISCKNR